MAQPPPAPRQPGVEMFDSPVRIYATTGGALLAALTLPEEPAWLRPVAATVVCANAIKGIYRSR